MEFLETLMDSTDVPLLTALLLGLLTAASPCPLATNITAIGYISKDIQSAHGIFVRGLLYTLGRTVAYTLLGAVLIYMICGGMDTFSLQSQVARWGELLLSPVLVVVGVLMLLGDRLRLPGLSGGSSGPSQSLRGAWGALLLGILLAMAFCPTSGLLYFGMLIPLSASSAGGYALPVVYALATGLPVVVVAWILAYSVGSVGRFYRSMQLFQKWCNRIVALLFIGVGIYYAFVMYA